MENVSEKVKLFLSKKRDMIQIKIKKLKRKRKIIKILYYSSVVSSVSLSTLIASLSGFVGLPMIVIASLSAGSGILTGTAGSRSASGNEVRDIRRAIFYKPRPPWIPMR